MRVDDYSVRPGSALMPHDHSPTPACCSTPCVAEPFVSVDPPIRRRGERCCQSDLERRVSPADADRLAADLALLAHPVRLQILDALACSPGRACVCDLEIVVPVKQPTISHHLRLLREAGVVVCERQGGFCHYRVDRAALDGLRARMNAGLERLF